MTDAGWLITGSFAIYSVLSRLLESSPDADMQFGQLWTFFRIAIGMMNVIEGLDRGIYQHSEYPTGAYWKSSKDTRQLHTICQWVRNQTPPNARIIATPKLNVIPYLCERPVVVSFRDVPSRPADFFE